MTTPVQNLPIDANVLQALAAFRDQPKFQAAPADARLRLTARLNILIDHLIATLAEFPTKSYVLTAFSRALQSFASEDSEDQDSVLQYLENIMDILGIESSDGLLNTWRYGFDPSPPE